MAAILAIRIRSVAKTSKAKCWILAGETVGIEIGARRTLMSACIKIRYRWAVNTPQSVTIYAICYDTAWYTGPIGNIKATVNTRSTILATWALQTMRIILTTGQTDAPSHEIHRIDAGCTASILSAIEAVLNIGAGGTIWWIPIVFVIALTAISLILWECCCAGSAVIKYIIAAKALSLIAIDKICTVTITGRVSFNIREIIETGSATIIIELTAVTASNDKVSAIRSEAAILSRDVAQ